MLGRLVISFAAIILVCLGLAGATFAYLLQPHQTQQALDRLSALALPVAIQVRILELQGATLPLITSYLDDQAEDMDIRILLVDENNQTVAHDSEGRLTGAKITLEGEGTRLPRVVQGTMEIPGEGKVAIALAIQFRSDRPRRRPDGNFPQYTVALAAPASTLAAEWLKIVPRLGTAGLISLLASVGVAYLMARSISRPLGKIRDASAAMARGDYNQRIEHRGRDEIAQLAATFNVMAEQVARSNRALRDFLADASHELRTPLTSIEGFSQAILDGTARDEDTIADSARIINEDALRMERIVADLSYLSKVQSGQLGMEMRAVDVAELTEGSVKRAQRRAPEQTIELRLPHGQLQVTADPGRIEQVLDNLLSNAINHTPPGGTITVTADIVGAEARIRVHNTGSYVPPEDRERIFQRFFHGDGAGAGTGLGLAIASEIARVHGGRIDLQSSPHDGTDFTLVLPAASVRVPAVT
jgi:signal transduction histidine kinase